MKLLLGVMSLVQHSWVSLYFEKKSWSQCSWERKREISSKRWQAFGKLTQCTTKEKNHVFQGKKEEENQDQSLVFIEQVLEEKHSD